MQKFQKPSIGSMLFLEIQGSENYENLFSEISDFLDFFEAKFSRFIKGNWLFDLNASKKAILDEHSYTMLDCMKKMARESQGFFDPTVGKRLTELGYGNQEIFFSPEKFNHRNFDEIISFDAKSIELHGDFELEFGGVGKWYLIDWIYDFLQKKLQNSENFLINFGGDMKCRGEYKVALESPFSSDEAIGIVTLRNQSLACSAGTKRKFWKNSHHLINPFSRESSSEVVATFLLSDAKNPYSAMEVDAWATALSVMSFEKSQNFLQNFSYISGLIIRQNGEFFKNENSSIELFL